MENKNQRRTQRKGEKLESVDTNEREESERSIEGGKDNWNKIRRVDSRFSGK